MGMNYSKSTDSEHKIKLESSLVYAIWRTGVARAGGKAEFEVGTAFVGNGAKIKVKGKSEGGEKLGKVSGKIRNNKFIGEFEIPEDVELDDAVYFEVELSQLSLSDESNRIPTAPPVVVSNMKWSASEARRGDILKLTADVNGCYDETEATITIYEHDADGVHDKITELPAVVMEDKIEIDWEYEYHEDTDEVPTEEELQNYGRSYNPPEYFFIIEIDGQKFGREQESGLLLFKDYIEIEMTDEGGVPLAGADYTLTLADGTEMEGQLDEDGRLRVDDVPPGRYQLYVTENADQDDEEDEEEDTDDETEDRDEEEEEEIQP
jgi:hypothetical protein